MSQHTRRNLKCPFVQGKAADNVTLAAEVWGRPDVTEVSQMPKLSNHMDKIRYLLLSNVKFGFHITYRAWIGKLY